MAPDSFGFTPLRNLRGGHQDRIEEVPRSGKLAKARPISEALSVFRT
jgi:hypothetical protein